MHYQRDLIKYYSDRKLYNSRGVIAPPKCQKRFGIATCQTDQIVLIATPVSGKNKNCIGADTVLKALLSLEDILAVVQT